MGSSSASVYIELFKKKSININISYKIMSASRKKYQKIRRKENIGRYVRVYQEGPVSGLLS